MSDLVNATASGVAVSHCEQQRLDDEAADSSSSGSEFALGVSLSLGASIFSNAGLNLQKFSLMRERLRPSGLVRGYVRQPLWWLGIFLVFLFSFGDFAALIYISQSVAAPLGGSTMVTNVILAHCWLGEPFTQRDALGVGIILAGLSLVGVFGSRSSQCYTMDELEDLTTDPQVVAYVLGVATLLIGLYGAAKLLERRRDVMGAYSPAWVSRWAKRERFILPALSGLLGGQTVLCAKGIAEVLESQSAGEPQLNLPGFWLLVAAMLSFIVMQIHWMAVAMKMYDNMYLQPVFQSFFLGSATLGGVVCFRELETVATVQRYIFVLGMGMLLLGVVVLTGRQQQGLPAQGRFRAAVWAVIFANHFSSPRRQQLTQAQQAKDSRRQQSLLPVVKMGETNADAAGVAAAFADGDSKARAKVASDTEKDPAVLTPPNRVSSAAATGMATICP